MTALVLTFAAAAAHAGTITFGPSAPGPAVPDAADLSGTAPGAAVGTSITIPSGNNFLISPGNSVTISLTGLNHTYLSDLGFTLTGPVVGPVVMLNHYAGSGCSFAAANTYSFNSGFAAMPSCSTLSAGNYAAAAGFSSAWNGVSIDNTVWTLSLQDFYAQDVQSAGWQWSLTVNADPVPEPATFGLAFAGLAVGFFAHRRRRG